MFDQNTSPAPSSDMAAHHMPSPSHGGPRRKWPILLGVLLLVIALPAVGFYQYGPRFLEEKAEETSVQVIENLESLQSGRVTVQIDIPLSQVPPNPDVAINLLPNPFESKDIRILLAHSFAQQDDQTNVHGRMQISSLPEDVIIGAEYITYDNQDYAQVTILPELGIFDLSPFLNQWITLGGEDMLEDLGVTDSIDPSAIGVYAAPVALLADDTNPMVERATELLQNDPPIFIHGAKLANGISHIVVDWSLDKQKLLSMVRQLESEFPELAQEDMVKLLDEGIQRLGGELVIDREALLPVRATATMHVQEEISGEYLPVEITLWLENVNQPVDIVAPVGALSPEQLMEQVFASMFAGLTTNVDINVGEGALKELDIPLDPTKVEDIMSSGALGDFSVIDLRAEDIIALNAQGPDTDGDGLADPIEDAIGTDKLNADTDGDGYNDFEEVYNGFSPFE